MRDSGSCGAGSNGGEASLPPRKSCRGYSSLRGRSGALLTCSETSVTLYTRPRPSSSARGYSSSANPGTAEAKGSGPERQGLGPCPEGVRRFESGPPHPRPPFRVVAGMGRGNGQGPHRFPDPRGPGGAAVRYPVPVAMAPRLRSGPRPSTVRGKGIRVSGPLPARHGRGGCPNPGPAGPTHPEGAPVQCPSDDRDCHETPPREPPRGVRGVSEAWPLDRSSIRRRSGKAGGAGVP